MSFYDNGPDLLIGHAIFECKNCGSIGAEIWDIGVYNANGNHMVRCKECRKSTTKLYSDPVSALFDFFEVSKIRYLYIEC